MKIKLTISRPDWMYSMTAYRGPKGEYYVVLANAEGLANPLSAIIGSFVGVDWIILNAEALYLQLMEKLNETLSKAASGSPSSSREDLSPGLI